LGGRVFLVIVVALIGIVLGNSRLLRTYKIQAEAIIIPSDASSIAQGKHIVNSVCTGCHGNDLSGGVAVFDAPPLGHIESANLTPGQGGKGGTYTDANWVLSIRHGIDEEGKSVLIMPSPMFYYFNDQDLAAIKTGALPNGKTLTDAMPWKVFSTLTDDEIKAAWMYIHSLPVMPTPKQ
jgi:cytochrome c5